MANLHISKYLLSVFVASAVAGAVGCGGAATNGSNAAPGTASNVNSNMGTAIKVDPANMPEGINTNPIQPSANSTPGIPANVTVLPKGATPTPGIPSDEERKNGMKPGVTPTPGIPSDEERRRMLGKTPLPASPLTGGTPLANTDRNVPQMKGTKQPTMMRSVNKSQ